jgi:hypothetical protein
MCSPLLKSPAPRVIKRPFPRPLFPGHHNLGWTFDPGAKTPQYLVECTRGGGTIAASEVNVADGPSEGDDQDSEKLSFASFSIIVVLEAPETWTSRLGSPARSENSETTAGTRDAAAMAAKAAARRAPLPCLLPLLHSHCFGPFIRRPRFPRSPAYGQQELGSVGTGHWPVDCQSR